MQFEKLSLLRCAELFPFHFKQPPRPSTQCIYGTKYIYHRGLNLSAFQTAPRRRPATGNPSYSRQCTAHRPHNRRPQAVRQSFQCGATMQTPTHPWRTMLPDLYPHPSRCRNRTETDSKEEAVSRRIRLLRIENYSFPIIYRRASVLFNQPRNLSYNNKYNGSTSPASLLIALYLSYTPCRLRLTVPRLAVPRLNIVALPLNEGPLNTS